MIADASLTVSVKFCVAGAPTPFVAVKVIGYVPPVPGPGTPDSTPVPALNVTPAGNAPDSLNAGVGLPLAVTVNEPSVPTVNVVALTLVIAAG